MGRYRLKRSCDTCGLPIKKVSETRCFHCRDLEERSSVPDRYGQGRRDPMSGRLATCKMPQCGREFELRGSQDPRYTWYCPRCRSVVAEFTDGVLWLQRWGIDVQPDNEVVSMDSLAKAFDEKEDNREAVFLQGARAQAGGVEAGRVVPGVPEEDLEDEEGGRQAVGG